MFITIEGIEGSGKSTLLEYLTERLKGAGHRVLATREPGGTPLGNEVRALLLQRDLEIAPLTEALLMNAARSQHVIEKIRPALAAGEVVLCDRFFDSTLAYQGYGRGLDLPLLRLISLAATGGLEPDLTLLLDLTVECSLARVAERDGQRGGRADRFESQDEAFHERVRRGYLEMAKSGARWHMLDAMLEPDALADRAWSVLSRLIEQHA